MVIRIVKLIGSCLLVIREAVKLQDVCIFQNAVRVLKIEASVRVIVSVRKSASRVLEQ